MLKTGLTDSLCDNESFAFSNLSEEIGEVAVGVEEKISVLQYQQVFQSPLAYKFC